MDPAQRHPEPGLSSNPGEAARLAGAARRMGFFALVQALERLYPDAPRVGEMGPVAEEAIRFRHDPSLAFPAADVSHVRQTRRPHDPSAFEPASEPGSEPGLALSQTVWEVTTTFLGLSGAVSPLPSYIAEEVAQEEPDAPVRREFLDVFHHRLISLLYRNWSRGAGPREQTRDLRDPWSLRVLALLGIDAFSRPPAHGLPADRILKLAPVLAARSRGAWALARALDVMFEGDLPKGSLAVHEFAGAWTPLETSAQFRLGQRNHRLGETSALGRKIFERSGTFELVIGPTTQAVYQRFLPGGDFRARLTATVDLILQDPLAYRVVLRLAAGAVPAWRLGPSAPSRLGHDSWLGGNRVESRVLVFTGTPTGASEAIAV